MRAHLRRLRLVALGLVLCVLAAACAALPGGSGERTVFADMASATNLFEGSEVVVLGLKVGQVQRLTPTGDGVRVEMAVDEDRPLPVDVGAELTPVTLIGERVVQLEPVYESGPQLEDGATIPRERTGVPPEVDDVLRSFEEFLGGLDETALADLITALADTTQGQGSGVNQLIAQGTDTVEVLADSSGDLNALVTELRGLNEVLEQRVGQIGPFLDDFSTVLRTVADEKDEITAATDNLRRLTAELRPLLTEQTDPLVRDLEILATTFGTVDRNLDYIAETYASGRRLTGTFGPNVSEFSTGRLRLDNTTKEFEFLIEDRLMERLAGLCLRLGLGECDDPMFWEPVLPALLCVEGVTPCDESRAGLGEALSEALGILPPEVTAQLAQEARQREAEEQARLQAEEQARADAEAQAQADSQQQPPPPAEQPGPAPDAGSPAPAPVLPPVDPRLEDDDDGGGLIDRLLGGGR